MTFLKKISLLFLTGCWLSIASAQQWALWLDKIDVMSETDYFGDQIYFFILQKNKDLPVAYTSMPDFPFSYTKENFQHFEPAILWQGDVSKNSDLALVVSLVEREALPWIADEVLGNLSVSVSSDVMGLSIGWNALTPSVSFDPDQKTPFAQRVHVEQNGGKYSFDLSWAPVAEEPTNA